MERRNFVLGLGALAAGSGAAVGTGAFSSVEAQREIGISVAGDADSYLAIESGTENGEYLTGADTSAAALDLTSSNSQVTGGGEGLNANALSTFADVFSVRNQGTQDVELSVTPLVYTDVDASFFGGVEAVLAVFLVPVNPDDIEVDIQFLDIELISVKDLTPGDELEFGMAAIAFPEEAIDSSSISEQLEITAEEV
jgi:hypothetical protein